MKEPCSQDIASAFAAYFFGGAGPSHSKLTTVFMGAGLGDVASAPEGGSTTGPNKEQRVQRTLMAALRNPSKARPLVEGLLSALRVAGWKIAQQVNVLRGLQGTGHGRTLPTGVTPEQAVLVVREACAVAEFALSSLDRQLGRRAA